MAEFLVFGLGLTIAGQALFAEYVGDYVLAIALGLAFQYYAIAPARGLGLRDGIVAAAKADILSLSAVSMQAGMIIGFFTAWPVNQWLIRRGVEEAM